MKKTILRILNFTALVFFIFIIFSTDYKVDKILDPQNLKFLCLSLIFLLISQLNIGLVWGLYLEKSSDISFKSSFLGWINSIKGKYVPGKITSPILRIENIVKIKNKKQYYIIVLIENIYLIISNIFLGAYVFLQEFYSFKYHIFFYVIINLILYVVSKVKKENIYFQYLSFTYLFQFTNLFNLVGIYFASKIFFIDKALEFALIYQLSIAISMIISIFPAGIGLREASTIEIAKSYGINVVEINNAVILFRILSLFTDGFLIFAEYIIKYRNGYFKS